MILKTLPKIEKYMTSMPHTIGKDIPLKTALSQMREYRIRHLPVQEGGQLIGVLTDRDVKLASSFQGAAEFKVEEVMTPDPYTVRPGTSLEQVVSEMAEHKYGCAIVQQDNGKVVGIFTTVDALRVLSEVLLKNYKPANF